jgi:hypothetical protein
MGTIWVGAMEKTEPRNKMGPLGETQRTVLEHAYLTRNGATSTLVSGMSRGTRRQAQRSLMKKGLMTEDGALTKAGIAYLESENLANTDL